MEYLNVTIAFTRSPEYIGSEPVDRATWLNLAAYCATMENGGVIAGCQGWKDRRCQQTLGITRKEMLSECELWSWQGEDLRVHFYPIEQEAIVIRKRGTARNNGKLGGRPKTTGIATNVGSQSHPAPEPTPVPILEPTADPKPEPTSESVKERKEKEGKEREETTPPAPVQKPTLSPSDLLPVDRVKLQLATVFPDAPRHYTGSDSHDLFSSLAVLDEFLADDWLACRAWIICPEKIRGRKLWPRNRTEFVANASEAIGIIRPWWNKGGGLKWWNAEQARPGTNPDSANAIPAAFIAWAQENYSLSPKSCWADRSIRTAWEASQQDNAA